MATITEILTEAFNRVKAEHGVNLSSVDFEHYSGSLSGVTFKAVSNVQPVYSYPAFPPQVPVAPAPIPWPQPHQMPQPPIVHQVDPNDCTHIGSVDVYDDCYWKFEGGVLYLWDGSGTWNTFDSGESAQRTVDSQLHPIANPDKGELVEMTPKKLADMIAPAVRSRRIRVKDEVFVKPDEGFTAPKSSVPAVVSHINDNGIATVS